MGIPSLDRVDPVQAWQPWQPDDNQPWSLALGRPLVPPGRVRRQPRRTAASRQGRSARHHRPPARRRPGSKKLRSAARRHRRVDRQGARTKPALRGWWLYAMLNSGHPLREKLTLFWHNHFATSIAKVRSTEAMYGQNQTLRQNALGNFRPMLADVSRDPAMLVWLDSNRNVKGQANENYAREVMELFTLGTGHYTETDIREAARAFTGWHTDGDKFTFAPRFHDTGHKTFLGQSGNWDGTDVQRIILNQPAAALFLVRKLYAYFIAESPSPPDSLLEPLAERFRQSDYDIGDLVGTMLRSRHFFSEYAYRQRIKSPVEYVARRSCGPSGRTPSPRELVQPLEAMGQSLFAPPNVKGWPGGKTWLNSATVLARQNFAQTMTVGPAPPMPVGRRGRSLAGSPPPPPAAGPITRRPRTAAGIAAAAAVVGRNRRRRRAGKGHRAGRGRQHAGRPAAARRHRRGDAKEVDRLPRQGQTGEGGLATARP